jgi:hypothetical protein
MEEERNYSSNSDNWNIAPGYANLQVLVPILNFSKYRRIAKFGTEHQETMPMPYALKVITRLEALDRMFEEADNLISGCLVGNKKKSGKKRYTDKRLNLEEIRLYLPGVKFELEDQSQRRTILSINEDFFEVLFNYLVTLQEEIVGLANEDGLIFPQSEVITKEDIMNKVINRG